ncbi:hypothetical protein HMPREF0908_1112 [Selenomonas flueggei ATCC 43531]|uniref:Uncharacterized protein n=1 Tax=Selenomonas flueggei ATCC 43531 TaxID=638302 RepID=C4V3L8_9FIRM|nr:hypothetical protein HMPREF0908_1112 [Selenomonas flueggei ATCC 43531]
MLLWYPLRLSMICHEAAVSHRPFPSCCSLSGILLLCHALHQTIFHPPDAIIADRFSAQSAAAAAERGEAIRPRIAG